jgi:HPt (histidine-containing phosphotransfer) domain-containing protein
MVFVPEAMLRNFSGYRSIAVAMLESLLTDVPERLDALSSALVAGDLGVGRREAHTIKGLGGNGGAPLLADLAREIEEYCRDGRLDEARQRLGALSGEIGHVVEEWRAFLRQPG